MDPDMTLAEIRSLTARIDHLDEHDHDRLAELITSLDEWISNGGFLPAAWR